jgi:hypothetical protein
MVRAPRFRLIQITRLQAFVLAAMLLGQARAEGIRFDNLQIPAVISTSRASHTFELEGLVVRPDDGQPHPLALLNHGSPMIDVSIPDVPAPESLNSRGARRIRGLSRKRSQQGVCRRRLTFRLDYRPAVGR